MSLTKTSLLENVKKQYRYKLNSYIWVFSSLMILQVLGILFSLGGTSSMSSGYDEIHVQISYYSADMVIGFTMLWSFIISTQITSTAYKENEFMFVINKESNNLSDAAFLLTASTIAGITGLLSSYLIKVIKYFILNPTDIIEMDVVSNPKYMVMGVLATILFIYLFSALGYTVGTLVQLNRIFVVVLPVLFIGLLYIAERLTVIPGKENFMLKLFVFYFQESDFLFFVVKFVITAAILFICSFLIASRLEVRR